jgi:hypothetical protein
LLPRRLCARFERFGAADFDPAWHLQDQELVGLPHLPCNERFNASSVRQATHPSFTFADTHFTFPDIPLFHRQLVCAGSKAVDVRFRRCVPQWDAVLFPKRAAVEPCMESTLQMQATNSLFLTAGRNLYCSMSMRASGR